MFPLLQFGEHMGKEQRILGRLGGQGSGVGKKDMMLAAAAANRRARAMVAAEAADGVLSLLDSIQLAHIEGIVDGGPSNEGWLGAEMDAEAFDLVDGLLGFQEWEWIDVQGIEIGLDVASRIFGETLEPNLKGHEAPAPRLSRD